MSDKKSKPIPRDTKRFAKPSRDEGKALLKPGATFPTAEQLADDILGRLFCPTYRGKTDSN